LLCVCCTGLVPGQVQNLKSTLDTKRPSLTLNWDKPNNVKTAKDVTAYDVRFRPSENRREESFTKLTLKAPVTCILLTRECGLNSLVKYDFEVRARNAKREGKWSTISEYTGTCAIYNHNVANVNCGDSVNMARCRQ